MTAMRAGAAYFAAVFAIGFALGTLRVFVLAPTFGEAGALMIELPVILFASWVACAAIIIWLAVPAAIGARALMGAVAFALLIAAEFALAIFGFGRSAAEEFARYATLLGAVGLAGQVLFALFPVIQLTRRS
ncbi:MAG: hypothetical protein AAFW81_07485 [Pseudomonadota bacterium]